MSSDEDMGQEFPGAPQQVDFWSLEIPPNKTVQAKLSMMPGLMEIAHVTSAALDENAKPGRHVVKIIPVDVDGSMKPEVALGTLELGRTDQFAIDFGFSSTMGFRHTGRSTVHLSGYMTRSYGDFEDMDDDEYESESEESGSESEDEEAPTAVPLQQNGKVLPVKGSSKAAAAANGPAAAAGDSSSEEEESEEGGSDDEDESDEGEEGEDADMMDVEADEDDEGESGDDEDESSDEGEDDEDEDESSDEEQPQPQQPAAKGKRSAQPMTPQPQQQAAKKQKGNEGQPVSASAPPKGAVSKTGGDAAAQYLSQLVSELKKSGPMPLSTLASKVKKPQDVTTKFKAFLTQHADKFTLNGENVSLTPKK